MVSADLLHLCQASYAPNISETRLEHLDRLSELGQDGLMKLAIQIIEKKATVTPSDPLERLAAISRQASPVDRLRIERTIRIVMRARQAVAAANRRR